MEVTCISVPNPFSYLICAGIKNVENRGHSTDFRGTLYIHSIGRASIRGMPDLSDYPVPLIHEFNASLAAIQELDRNARFIGIQDAGVRIVLKDEAKQPAWAVNQYALLSDVYHAYRERPNEPYFLVNAIIGTAELVDVVRGSRSEWAEEGYHHWILERPELFRQPVPNVRTSRSGVWTYNLPG